MALDERLRREIERAARPADPSGVYEELIRRRERRRIAHRVEAGALALVVFAATAGGFFVLTRVFRQTDEPPAIVAPPVSNGRIVFSIPLEGEGVALMSVLPDGTGLHRLTRAGTAVYRSPDISPDGSTVVAVQDIGGDGLGGDVLVTVPIDGGSPTRLTKEPGIVFDPAWSPDGERVAFAGSDGINVLDIATGEARLIPGTDDMLYGNPSWSPDGGTIAFEGAVPDPANPVRFPWDIYSVRLDGSRLTNLTRTPDEGETFPAWSWANGRIAFVRGGNARPGLYTIAADGTDEVLITDELQTITDPAWSPDGTQLAIAADTGQVYRIEPDGSFLIAVQGVMGETAWQAIPEGTMIPPVEPTPTPSPDPEQQDIGLGFPVCNVTSVTGRFADPNTPGIAFVATRMGDTGGCPQREDGLQLLAVDVSGDGLADASFGPLGCEQACSAFAAPDVDGDGTDELLVQNIEFSVVGLQLFELLQDADQPTLVAVTVEPPGDAAQGFQGFDGSGLPQFWVGGDGFGSDALRCEPAGGGRVLISSTAQMVPPDSPDAVWEVHETTFVLEGGVLRVVDARDFTWPINDDVAQFLDTGGCGADLEPYG